MGRCKLLPSAFVAAGVLAFTAASAFAGQITLFESSGFQGRSATATTAMVPNLKTAAFSDGAASIVVGNGTWEACTEPYFHGRCAQLAPGNYANLSRDFGLISSVREFAYATPVAAGSMSAPVIIQPGPATVVVNPTPTVVINADSQVVAATPPAVVTAAPVATPIPAPPGRAVLYQFPNFTGPTAIVQFGRSPDLDWANFHYPAASVRIESGNWVACTEMGYRGQCRVLGPGDYPVLTGILDPGIASLRPVA